MEYEVSLGSDDLDGKTPRQVTLLPFLVKKSLEYLPAIMSLRGTLPSSSMINAIWSIWLQEEEGGGAQTGQTTDLSDKVPVRDPLWECGCRSEVRLTAHQ